MVNLDRCDRNCNTLDGPYDTIYVPNKTENVNLSVSNMIARMKDSKTLRTHISCECKCKFDGIKCKIT